VLAKIGAEALDKAKALEAEAGKKAAGKVPTDADYQQAMRDVAGKLRNINDELTQGRISVDEWADRFDAELLEGHYQALRLGFERAGSFDYDEEKLRGVARGIKDTESEFLSGYMDADGETWHPGWIANLRDVEDGRYHNDDGTFKDGSLDSRADLYVGRMRGSANEAFVEASDPEAEITWELGPTEHCPDCLDMADGNPYTADTLFAYPGDGSQICLGNCACQLEIAGVRGFGNHNGDASEDVLGDEDSEAA